LERSEQLLCDYSEPVYPNAYFVGFRGLYLDGNGEWLYGYDYHYCGGERYAYYPDSYEQ